MDEIKNVIRNYIVREYVQNGDGLQITNTTPLISGGLVDSFSMVSLLRFIEKKFAIHIPDSAATPESFDTVESIASIVRRFQKSAVKG